MDPKKEPSEADFIVREQAQARAAITQTLADMKQAVAQGVDVAEWTRQHPWILMGAAAVAGVVAGRLVTPSKEETLKDFFEEKWEGIKDKFTPAVPPEAAARSAGGATAEKTSMLGSVIRETMKAVGPALMGLITNMMAPQQDPSHDGNGHNGNGSHGQDEAGETPPEV